MRVRKREGYGERDIYIEGERGVGGVGGGRMRKRGIGFEKG